ncbi:hypothetical protein M5D96_004565, partial [Drosophila gunungcola]
FNAFREPPVPFYISPLNSAQPDSIRFVLIGNVQFSYVCQYYATSSFFKVPRVTSSATRLYTNSGNRYRMDMHIELLTIVYIVVELLVCLLFAASELENVI